MSSQPTTTTKRSTTKKTKASNDVSQETVAQVAEQPQVVVQPVSEPSPSTSETVLNVASVSEAPSVQVINDGGVSKLTSVSDCLASLTSMFQEGATANKNGLQVLKRLTRLYEKGTKKRQRRVPADGTKVNTSGFNKPRVVPAAIATYLGLSKELQLSRTDVTRRLYAKFKELNLQGKEVLDSKTNEMKLNKRYLKTTPEITSLFMLQPGEEVGFNTFQKYLSRQYETVATTE